MNDTTRIDKNQTGPRSMGWTIAGGVVLALGIAQLVLSIFGTGRELTGALFFNTQKVDGFIAEAVSAAEPFQQVCLDPASAAAFDEGSVQNLQAWCGSVNAMVTTKAPADAVTLLRMTNRHFTKLTEHMLNRGGKAGELAATLLGGACMVRPPLEDVFSAVAGAAFSQALIGIFMIVFGSWALRKAKGRGPTDSVATPDAAPAA